MGLLNAQMKVKTDEILADNYLRLTYEAVYRSASK